MAIVREEEADEKEEEKMGGNCRHLWLLLAHTMTTQLDGSMLM
jgi:hypothetical protein